MSGMNVMAKTSQDRQPANRLRQLGLGQFTGTAFPKTPAIWFPLALGFSMHRFTPSKHHLTSINTTPDLALKTWSNLRKPSQTLYKSNLKTL